jgi:uncharacterized protein YyaL (SSP411 family)
MTPSSKANALIKESSLYLQQHAHNPVNWLPWSDDAFKIAASENKLVLISIGYSSCHWCHVMEKEVFEDNLAAQLMNEKLICIKVDREERPDVDNLYMNAVQLLTGGGGWPLNCFALPDGRPVYGGTYFNKQQWISLINQLTDLYQTDRSRLLSYADDIQNGLLQTNLVPTARQKPDSAWLLQMIDKWKTLFDDLNGGHNRAPKFPMPVNLSFLLHYGWHNQDKTILDFVKLTLSKMYGGGIFDQLEGGFARYSVDRYWKVPHFEKMLYDNAQLITIYTAAWQYWQEDNFKNAATHTIEFLLNQLYDADGFFYASVDADSEGHEGKYYLWNRDEINNLLSEIHLPEIPSDKIKPLIYDYYNLHDGEEAEGDNFVLHRTLNDISLQKKYELTDVSFKNIIEAVNNSLLKKRKLRIAPVCDKKMITSWNALCVSALSKASAAFNNHPYLEKALAVISYLEQFQLLNDGRINHCGNISTHTNLFLEDYAFLAEAYLNLYESTWNIQWINKADIIVQDAIKYFSHPDQVFFYDESGDDKKILIRKTELQDNVIPSSNSVMAHNLFLLGKYLNRESYLERSRAMSERMIQDMVHYGAAYAHWAKLLLCQIYPFYEVVTSNTDSTEKPQILKQHYLPSVITAHAGEESLIPFAHGKKNTKGQVYVCYDQTCMAPMANIEDALTIILSRS